MTEILVTGATGQVGGAVARGLEGEGARVRALVRDVERARARLRNGVELVERDLGDAAAVARAVDWVGAVLLVSSVHPDQRRLQGNVVRAAAAAGQPLIVKVSGLATRPGSYVDSGRWHAETEADVRAARLPFVFLRPYFFFQNLRLQLGRALEDGVLRAAVGDARIAMVDVRDVADVAVALLTGRATRTGEALALTGAEAHGYADVAKLASELAGRELRYEPQTAAEARAALAATGLPDWHRDILLQFNRAFVEGLGSPVSDAVQTVLGRPPRMLRAYLAEEFGS